MTEDAPGLRPATESEILFDLAFALRHDGRRAFRTADGMMAAITADHLLKFLERAGYVLMKKPLAPSHSAPRTYKVPGEDQ